MMMESKLKTDLITRIIELEYQITISIIQGHRPYIGDKFQSYRNELETLRCIVFGQKSTFCKKNIEKDSL